MFLDLFVLVEMTRGDFSEPTLKREEQLQGLAWLMLGSHLIETFNLMTAG